MAKPSLSRRIRKRAFGFSLLEFMIVMTVVGLISAIALLNYMRTKQAAQARSCSQSLEWLDGAKAQAAFEFALGNNDVPTDAQLAPFLGAPPGTPIDGSSDFCPAGGIYSVNDLATPPTCNLASGAGKHQMQ